MNQKEIDWQESIGVNKPSSLRDKHNIWALLIFLNFMAELFVQKPIMTSF